MSLSLSLSLSLSIAWVDGNVMWRGGEGEGVSRESVIV
jgi:hypothetical protein